MSDTDQDRGDVPEFARIRLFVEAGLSAGARIELTAGQSHYLRNVMRRGDGEAVRAFNGADGEWAARLSTAGRRTELVAERRTRAQDAPCKVALAFAPIKKSPMEYLVEKATELGAAHLQPVATERTQVHHVNRERLRAQAIEAAEQSWRLSVPTVAEPVALDAFLAAHAGTLVFCDERLASGPREGAMAALAAAAARPAPWTILIGPEGGFSPAEQARIATLPGAVAISLGPRIVRAETAAVMALTLWQAALGDLRSG